MQTLLPLFALCPLVLKLSLMEQSIGFPFSFSASFCPPPALSAYKHQGFGGKPERTGLTDVPSKLRFWLSPVFLHYRSFKDPSFQCPVWSSSILPSCMPGHSHSRSWLGMLLPSPLHPPPRSKYFLKKVSPHASSSSPSLPIPPPTTTTSFSPSFSPLAGSEFLQQNVSLSLSLYSPPLTTFFGLSPIACSVPAFSPTGWWSLEERKETAPE